MAGISDTISLLHAPHGVRHEGPTWPNGQRTSFLGAHHTASSLTFGMTISLP